ncbi:MAG: DNA-binding response regulator, partial [Gammaproteobacteria bacterium]
MSTIRILLVDDHSLFRTGIKSLLESQDGFEVVGEASDGLEGV